MKWNNEYYFFKGQLFITHHLTFPVAEAVTLCLESWWIWVFEVNLPENQHRSFYIVLWLCVIFGWIMFLYSDKHWHLNLYFKVLNTVLFWGVGGKYCKYLNSSKLNIMLKLKDYIIFKLCVKTGKIIVTKLLELNL